MKETDCSKCCVCAFKEDLCKEDFCEKYYREGSAEDFEKLLPRWTLCSERLPEDDTEVIVSCTDDSGDSKFSYTTTGWHFKGLWIVDNERSCFVTAWMSLPKPYEER